MFVIIKYLLTPCGIPLRELFTLCHKCINYILQLAFRLSSSRPLDESDLSVLVGSRRSYRSVCWPRPRIDWAVTRRCQRRTNQCVAVCWLSPRAGTITTRSFGVGPSHARRRDSGKITGNAAGNQESVCSVDTLKSILLLFPSGSMWHGNSRHLNMSV